MSPSESDLFTDDLSADFLADETFIPTPKQPNTDSTPRSKSPNETDRRTEPEPNHSTDKPEPISDDDLWDLTGEDESNDGLSKDRCPKCGSTESWGMASWCPSCGYYPALGTTVSEESIEAPPPAEKSVQVPSDELFDETLDNSELWEETSEVENWWELIPSWGITAGIGILAIFGAAVGLRITFNADPSVRFLLTAGCTLVGLGVLGTLHFLSYLYAVPVNDELSPTDLFMKPLLCWKQTFRNLPETKNRVIGGIWSLSVVLAGLLIIAGFRYNAVFEDWGFKKRAQKNLVQEIVAQAKQAEEEEDSMEDGINDLVGDGETEDEENAELKEQAQCLVIGYSTHADGRLSMLFLATTRHSGQRLKYAGFVSATNIPEEDRIELERNLPKFERSTPLVKAPVTARWLQPKFLVEVGFEKWTSSNRMQGPKFKELLAEID